MDKVKIGTCWLDGCSAAICRCSIWTRDRRRAREGRHRVRPAVDAQEWPEGVDVALIEGAVSSQDDLELALTARERSKMSWRSATAR